MSDVISLGVPELGSGDREGSTARLDCNPSTQYTEIRIIMSREISAIIDNGRTDNPNMMLSAYS